MAAIEPYVSFITDGTAPAAMDRAQASKSQQAVLLFANQTVTLAGARLQAPPIADPYDAVSIVDDPGALQGPRGERHARTPYAEHRRQQVLRHRKLVFVDDVVGHQQPTRVSLPDR